MNMSIDLKNLKCGFLLFEALICLLIIGVVSLSISIWFVKIIESQNLTMRKSEALLHACNLLEMVRSTNKIPENVNSIGIYKIKWEFKPDIKVHNFKQVDITVQWKEKDISHEINISTGMISI